jgi:hypothetical protein
MSSGASNLEQLLSWTGLVLAVSFVAALALGAA